MNNYSKTLKQLILNKRQRKQKGNQDWTHRQHWVHKTQDEDKQNKRHNAEN